MLCLEWFVFVANVIPTAFTTMLFIYINVIVNNNIK